MGVWVKGTHYGNSSKRHYYESDEVLWNWTRLSHNVDAGINWFEYMQGRSICSNRTNGYGVGGDGRAHWSTWKNRLVVDRGLSIKYDEDIKLTQANLCFYCKGRYIHSKPELEKALRELGVI